LNCNETAIAIGTDYQFGTVLGVSNQLSRFT
jgi:hypothetical protein